MRVALWGALLSCLPLIGGVAPGYLRPRPALDYFLPHTFRPDSRADTFVCNWFSKHLAAMGEPPLSSRTAPDTIRLLYLRTFHHPICVRVETSGRRAALYAVELTGAGGYEPGYVLRQTSRELDPTEWRALERGFAALRLWELPTIKPKLVLDGSEWVVEAVQSDRYHVVWRQSPSESDDPELRAFGLRLLELSGHTPQGALLY